uniref:Uncharacterized protein LOC102809228 n=1 Tax=Saccoglossus kowalevskii TaxID=10224 RepID=A0ABM0MKG1_SACKO|nr:PREDICTED: uncharacterized protein LOC102809228 [Saccoglossus kowalevskii]
MALSRRKFMEEGKRQLRMKLLDIEEREKQMYQYVADLIKPASTCARKLLSESDKNKFYRNYKEVSSSVTKCLDTLWILCASLLSDETDTDGNGNTSNTSSSSDTDDVQSVSTPRKIGTRCKADFRNKVTKFYDDALVGSIMQDCKAAKHVKIVKPRNLNYVKSPQMRKDEIFAAEEKDTKKKFKSNCVEGEEMPKTGECDLKSSQKEITSERDLKSCQEEKASEHDLKSCLKEKSGECDLKTCLKEKNGECDLKSFQKEKASEHDLKACQEEEASESDLKSCMKEKNGECDLKSFQNEKASKHDLKACQEENPSKIVSPKREKKEDNDMKTKDGKIKQSPARSVYEISVSSPEVWSTDELIFCDAETPEKFSPKSPRMQVEIKSSPVSQKGMWIEKKQEILSWLENSDIGKSTDLFLTYHREDIKSDFQDNTKESTRVDNLSMASLQEREHQVHPAKPKIESDEHTKCNKPVATKHNENRSDICLVETNSTECTGTDKEFQNMQITVFDIPSDEKKCCNQNDEVVSDVELIEKQLVVDDKTEATPDDESVLLDEIHKCGTSLKCRNKRQQFYDAACMISKKVKLDVPKTEFQSKAVSEEKVKNASPRIPSLTFRHDIPYTELAADEHRLNGSIYVGMIVAGCFSVDDTWYRAKIIAIHPNTTDVTEISSSNISCASPTSSECSSSVYEHSALNDNTEVDVLYIDYGNKERLLLKRLRVLQEEFTKLPSQAVCCCLAQVRPPNGSKYWLNEQILYFNNLVYGKSLHGVISTVPGSHLFSIDLSFSSPAVQVDTSNDSKLIPMMQFNIAQLMKQTGNADIVEGVLDMSKIKTVITGTDGEDVETKASLNLEQANVKDLSRLPIENDESLNKNDHKTLKQTPKPPKHTFDGTVLNERQCTQQCPDEKLVEPLQSCLSSINDDKGGRSQENQVVKQNLQISSSCETETGFSERITQEHKKKEADVQIIDSCETQVAKCKIKTSEIIQQDDVQERQMKASLGSRLFSETNVAENKIETSEIIQLDDVQMNPSLNSRLLRSTEEDVDLSVTPQVHTNTSFDLSGVKVKARQNMAKSVLSTSQQSSPRVVKFHSVNRGNIKPLRKPVVYQQLKKVPLEMGPGGDIHVVMSHISTPAEFYVHVVTSHSRKLDYFIEEMNDHYKNLNCDQYMPHVGEICCANFDEDGGWYRAQVKDIMQKNGSQLIKVFYVDFGNVELVPVTSIRKLDKNFMEFPEQVLKCCLEDVHPLSHDANDNTIIDRWSRGTIEKFKELTGYRQSLYLRNWAWRGSVLSAILFNFDGLNINQELVNYRLATSTTLKKGLSIRDDSQSNADTCDSGNGCSQSISVGSDNDVGSGNASFDSLADWDPMSMHFLSESNSYALDMDDPGVATVGYKSNNKSAVCKFFYNGYVCYRGEACPYEHSLPGESSEDRLAVLRSSSTVVLPKDDSWVHVEITAIHDPLHFWVQLPYGNKSLDQIKHEAEEGVSDSGVDDEEGSSFQDLMKSINAHYKNSVYKDADSDTLPPRRGEIVCAQLTADNKWYRALITDVLVEKEKVKAFYLDYGNSEFLRFCNIRTILPEFLLLPFQAVECFLFDLEPLNKGKECKWSKKVVAKFEKEVVNKTLEANVVCSSCNVMYINLYSTTDDKDVFINQWLIEKGYAKKQVKNPPKSGDGNISKCESDEYLRPG